MKTRRFKIPSMRAMWRWVINIPARLSAIPESPHDIAKAFAVGVFIGIMPGMGSAIALLAAFVFRLSKIATLLGSLLTNPWTVAFVYTGSFKIGNWILKHRDPIDWQMITSLRTGWPAELGRVAPPLIVGGVVLGIILALISYTVVRWMVVRYAYLRLKREHEHHMYDIHSHPPPPAS